MKGALIPRNEDIKEVQDCRDFPCLRRRDHSKRKHILRFLSEVSYHSSDLCPRPLRKDDFHVRCAVLFSSSITPKYTFLYVKYKVCLHSVLRFPQISDCIMQVRRSFLKVNTEKKLPKNAEKKSGVNFS